MYEFLSDFKTFDATNSLCNTLPVDTAYTVDTSSFVPSSFSYVVDDDVVGTSPFFVRNDVAGTTVDASSSPSPSFSS